MYERAIGILEMQARAVQETEVKVCMQEGRKEEAAMHEAVAKELRGAMKELQRIGKQKRRF